MLEEIVKTYLVNAKHIAPASSIEPNCKLRSWGPIHLDMVEMLFEVNRCGFRERSDALSWT